MLPIKHVWTRPQRSRAALALVLASAAAACVGVLDSPTDDPSHGQPAFAPAVGNLRRLTTLQYQNTVQELVGPEVLVPRTFASDLRSGVAIRGLVNVGVGVVPSSADEVERFTTNAYDVANQAMTLPVVRDRLVTCTPTGMTDDVCASTFVTTFGRRAYRRPLQAIEVTALVSIAHQAASALGNFHTGLSYAMAAILMSPSFVYRAELGAESPSNPSVTQLDAFELAQRVSFFLWNAPPDATLTAAAESGVLLTDAGLAAEVDRLIADDRIHQGLRAFFTDMLQLDSLDSLNKDPAVFVLFSAEVGPIAREETLRTIEHHVLDLHGDYRDLFTTRQTFIDRKLASIYDVPAPSLTDFAPYEHPETSLRRGILGQVAFLAQNSHPASSSAVLRGQFVRTVLLCGEIPSPPANANTAIPEPGPNARTLRDRVLVHFQNPTCRGCHQLMDPIGLSYENFDGLGRFRTMENGATIDASGSLNSQFFANAAQLGQVLHDHPDVPPCFVRTMYRYATGHVEVTSETAALSRLSDSFGTQGFDVLRLMRATALDAGFRLTSPPELTPGSP